MNRISKLLRCAALIAATGDAWISHDSNLARAVSDRSLGLWTVSNVTAGKPGA